MEGNEPFVSEEGHFILDLHLGKIGSPADLARELNLIPGVVENGLFVGLCDTLVIGCADGAVDVSETAENGGGQRGPASPPERKPG